MAESFKRRMSILEEDNYPTTAQDVAKHEAKKVIKPNGIVWHWPDGSKAIIRKGFNVEVI